MNKLKYPLITAFCPEKKYFRRITYFSKTKKKFKPIKCKILVHLISLFYFIVMCFASNFSLVYSFGLEVLALGNSDHFVLLFFSFGMRRVIRLRWR